MVKTPHDDWRRGAGAPGRTRSDVIALKVRREAARNGALPIS
jgi:hypothetical protein